MSDIQEFLNAHDETRKLLDEQKLAEAKKSYLSVLDAYNKIDQSSMEAFHKEIAYEKVQKLFADLNEAKERGKLPLNLIAAGVLVLVLSVVVVFNPTIVGLVGFEDEVAQPINISLDETDVISITLRDNPLSLALSGVADGHAKIYLKQGEKLTLVADVSGEFTNVCEDTCGVKHGSSEVELFVQLDEGSTIQLTEIVYRIPRTENTAPVWSGPREFTLSGNALEIDLAEHFEDPEGDALVYLSTGAEGLDVEVEQTVVHIRALPDASGEKRITLIASDFLELTKIPVTITI